MSTLDFSPETHELRVRLLATGLKALQTDMLLARFEAERIRRQLIWLLVRNARNPAAFLLSAIEKDYAPPPGSALPLTGGEGTRNTTAWFRALLRTLATEGTGAGKRGERAAMTNEELKQAERLAEVQAVFGAERVLVGQAGFTSLAAPHLVAATAGN